MEEGEDQFIVPDGVLVMEVRGAEGRGGGA